MLRRFGFALCATLAMAGTAFGADRVYLGWSSISANDTYGDGQDRWQTASLQTSFLFGPKGTDSAPFAFGELLEWRGGFQIITPANTLTPAPGDRAAAGILRGALYTQFARNDWSFALGAGVEGVGPATGVLAVQDLVHQALGTDRAAPAVLAGQVGNRLQPMLGGEAAYRFAATDHISFRPFVEGRYGLESYARAGVDVIVGPGFDGVISRDHVTGQLYRVTNGPGAPDVSLLFGVDTARVFSSSLVTAPTPMRTRIRGGMLVAGDRFSVFYGATYLSPEFTAQPSGQVVGSLQVRLKF